MPGLGLESPATCGGTPLSRTAPGRRQLLVEEIFYFHAGPGLPFFAKCGRRTGDDACDFESADQGHPKAGAWRSIPGDFRLPPPTKAPILQP